MGKRLDGQVAIVTGATSGIGEAIVELYASEGAKVVFAGRRLDKGQALEKKVSGNGGDVLFVQTDVNKLADLKNLVAKALQKYGKIDILVNNAGVGAHYDSEMLDEEKDYDFVMDTNVKSYFVLTREVLPHMVKNNKGSIINTSSVAGVVGLPNAASYSASKGAVNQFTKTLALEYASRGIRVNAVLPGLTTSEMVPEGSDFEKNVLPSVPMGRAASSEEMARTFVFFASEDSSYCTGALLVVDGGLTAM